VQGPAVEDSPSTDQIWSREVGTRNKPVTDSRPSHALTQAVASVTDRSPLATPSDRLRRFARAQLAAAPTDSAQRTAKQAPNAEQALIRPISLSVRAAAAVVDPGVTMQPPATAVARLAPTTTLLGVISNVFGLGSPTSPFAPLRHLLELAFVAVRRTLFNRTPTGEAKFTVDSSTAVATGRIIGNDADGDQLTYTLGTPPAQGKVDLKPDGTFTYEPEEGWAHNTGGAVDFTVIVSDASSPPHLHLFSGGHQNVVPVHYVFTESNAAPDVRITDVDSKPDGSITYTVTTVDDDGDPVGLMTAAVNGTLAGGATSEANTYQYTFTPDPVYAHNLTLGGKTAAGEGSVTFTGTDGRGGKDDETAKIVIAAVNGAPVVTVDPIGDVYTVTVTDGDKDTTILTPTVTNGTLTPGGTQSEPGKTTYTYTFALDPAYAHGLTLGGSTQTGTATVAFVATDGHGGVDDKYKDTIAVDGTNAKPVVAVSKSNDVYTVTVTDGDVGDQVTLTPTVTKGKLQPGATQTEPGKTTYTYTFTPDPAYAHGLTVGGATQPGSATVAFAATDGHGGQSAYSDTVSVAGVNSAPGIAKVSGTTVRSTDGFADVVLTLKDADGDDVQVTGATVPANRGTVTKIAKNADGTWTVTYRASFAEAHALGPNGTAIVPLTVTLADGHTAGPATSTVGVTLVGLNRPPELDTDPEVNRKTGVVSGTADWTDRDGDTLRNYTATLSDPTTGDLAYDAATGAYTFTPNAEARNAATVVGAPLDDRRVLVNFTVADDYGSYTVAVPVVIAPPDNQILRTYAADDDTVDPFGPAFDGANNVVVTPDGRTIFVTNGSSGVITRINAQTGEIEQTGYLVGGHRPGDPAGSTLQLIVTPPGAADEAVYALGSDHQLWKFDGANDWDVTSVDLGVTANHIAVSEDGKTVYFVDRVNSTTRIRAVDTATMTIDPTPIAIAPDGEMAVEPGTGYIVIDNGTSNGYTVIDPATRRNVQTTSVPFDVKDFAFADTGMWVISDDTLVQVGTTDGRALRPPVAVNDPLKVVASPDGERVYVLRGNSSVQVLDSTKQGDLREVAVINVPRGATDIAIDPDGTHLYVTGDALTRGDQVTVISISPGEPPEAPDTLLSV
jgi:VCBS repeat-containing protein